MGFVWNFKLCKLQETSYIKVDSLFTLALTYSLQRKMPLLLPHVRMFGYHKIQNTQQEKPAVDNTRCNIPDYIVLKIYFSEVKSSTLANYEYFREMYIL